MRIILTNGMRSENIDLLIAKRVLFFIFKEKYMPKAAICVCHDLRELSKVVFAYSDFYSELLIAFYNKDNNQIVLYVPEGDTIMNTYQYVNFEHFIVMMRWFVYKNLYNNQSCDFFCNMNLGCPGEPYITSLINDLLQDLSIDQICLLFDNEDIKLDLVKWLDNKNNLIGESCPPQLKKNTVILLNTINPDDLFVDDMPLPLHMSPDNIFSGDSSPASQNWFERLYQECYEDTQDLSSIALSDVVATIEPPRRQNYWLTCFARLFSCRIFSPCPSTIVYPEQLINDL